MKKFFRSKRRLVIIAAVLAVAIILLILTSGGDVTNGIEMEAVARGKVVEIVSETGFVQPSREVVLAFEQSGKVDSIPVTEGSVVAAGDILVALDTSEKKTELTAASARLEAERVTALGFP